MTVISVTEAGGLSVESVGGLLWLVWEDGVAGLVIVSIYRWTSANDENVCSPVDFKGCATVKVTFPVFVPSRRPIVI